MKRKKKNLFLNYKEPFEFHVPLRRGNLGGHLILLNSQYKKYKKTHKILFCKRKFGGHLILLNSQYKKYKKTLEILFCKRKLNNCPIFMFFSEKDNWAISHFHVLLKRGELGGHMFLSSAWSKNI
jgi:hypothetical protein